MKNYFFTSESVTEGHPDKVADLISDNVANYLINQNESHRAAIETMVSSNMVTIAGEVKTDLINNTDSIEELVRHTDRSASEISISIHVSTNIIQKWPFWIKTPDIYDDEKSEVKEYGKNVSINLDAGDGVLYKGCERPHWRDRMPGVLETELPKKFNKEVPQLYYHQIFFHYVLQDGIRAHFAWDVYR